MAEETDEQINPAEYSQALRSIRRAKNWFFLLIGLAIVVQIAAFVGVQFFGLLDGSQAVTGSPAAAQEAVPASMPAPPATGRQLMMTSQNWYSLLSGLLPGAQVLALVMVVLLVLTLLLAAMVSLVGRLGGVDGMIGAFFWSLILLVVLIPWQDFLQMRLASGALFNLDELIAAAKGIKKAWGAEDVGMSRYILYYARFLGYPLVALVIWLSKQGRFGYGYRTMRARQAEMES
jgi:hypothetical protein